MTNLDTPTYPDAESSYVRNAPIDFVDTDALRHFCSSAIGVQPKRDRALTRFARTKLRLPAPVPKRAFAVAKFAQKDPVASPHSHLDVLGRASGATLVCWGEGEVLADDAAKLCTISDKWQALTAPSVHAWPMVLFNLGRNVEEVRGSRPDHLTPQRATGCESIGRWVRDHMPANSTA